MNAYDLNAALTVCLLVEDRHPAEMASLNRLQAALNEAWS